MPVFVEDPSQFSKSRLKSDLVAHNVALPAEDSKKQVYVELHLKHIDHKSAADFSSDEEELQATDDVAVTEERKHLEDSEMLDPSGLTDDELRAALLKYGVKAGPILATTRALYEKRLAKALQADQPSLNGAADAAVLYSDSEEEEEFENGEDDENVVEVDAQEEDSKHTVQEPDSSLDQSQPEKPVLEEPVTVDEPVTKLSADAVAYSNPPGIVVTRRRPIKGAAGRPVTYKYPVVNRPPLAPVSPTTAERRELERRLVPIWVRILVFVVVACLLVLIYTWVNGDDLFVSLLDSLSRGSEEEQMLTSEDTPVTDPIPGQE